MMNPEIKAKWLEALRSGEYKQGKGALVEVKGDERFYCCLGVLCDLAAKEGVTREADGGTLGVGFMDRGAVEHGILPLRVQEWAGLAGPNPVVRGEALAVRNDQGESFDEIADVIEERL